MNNEKTGWERENRVHFDEIAVNYDRYRWDYPAELFADAIQYSEHGNGKKAIEIGAGTGKSTTPFLDAVYDVTAIEMSANMSVFLLDKFKEYQNFNVITSTFEDARLDDDSYDLIYSASAFHWIDADVGCPKVMRLLKNGGAFVLFRNNAVRSNEVGIFEAVNEAYEKHYYAHYPNHRRPIDIFKMTHEDFLKPEEIYRGFRFNSLQEYGFDDVTMNLYNAARMYAPDEYISLMDTMSDHRALPEHYREPLYADIKKAIVNHGGQMEMSFIFQLYMGRKMI
jgi:ubiquinone/menaquinone biosynthesis C-methylase UbiE